jgi:hypothetical protein
MSRMSVCVHGRVRKPLNTELVAQYFARSQSCEKRPIATSASVHMHVRPSVYMNSAPVDWTAVKFRANYNYRYNLTRVTCTLRKYQSRFMKLFL